MELSVCCTVWRASKLAELHLLSESLNFSEFYVFDEMQAAANSESPPRIPFVPSLHGQWPDSHLETTQSRDTHKG